MCTLQTHAALHRHVTDQPGISHTIVKQFRQYGRPSATPHGPGPADGAAPCFPAMAAMPLPPPQEGLRTLPVGMDEQRISSVFPSLASATKPPALRQPPPMPPPPWPPQTADVPILDDEVVAELLESFEDDTEA